LYLEAAKWSNSKKILEDPAPGEMTTIMPIIHFLPKEVLKDKKMDDD